MSRRADVKDKFCRYFPDAITIEHNN